MQNNLLVSGGIKQLVVQASSELERFIPGC